MEEKGTKWIYTAGPEGWHETWWLLTRKSRKQNCVGPHRKSLGTYSQFGAWSHGLYTRVLLGWLGLRHHIITRREVSVDEVVAREIRILPDRL